MKRLTLELDEQDHAAICEAIARRQLWRVMPETEEGERSNTSGAVLAEICRGWVELVEAKGDDEPWR